MRFVEVQSQGPLSRPNQQMHPDKVREDPPRRGRLDRRSFLMRTRRLMVPEGLADAILQGGIDQQTPRHDHQQRHEPLGFFEIARRGPKARIVEEAQAAFGMLLAVIGLEYLLG
jgi:hypothetical protein